MMISILQFVVVLATYLGVVTAHPGHDIETEALARRTALQDFSRRSLSHCSSHLKSRGLAAKTFERRAVLANKLRRRRAVPRRSLQNRSRRSTISLNSTYPSHESNTTCGAAGMDLFELCTGPKAACVLQPDVTQGPYYVSGEMVRTDVREQEDGITLYVDIQMLDIGTCEPVQDVYMDLWHSNATGVYSGVVADGNGDSADAANLNTTFLRGIQKTDANGAVQMTTIFPGHYTGRTTHIHILAHASDVNVDQNDTTPGDCIVTQHVGQLFFDQDLIAAVEATEPYRSNTQELTLNADDLILGEESESSDPFMEYMLLGEDMTDGILAWISIGVNMSGAAVYDVEPAVTLTEHGGVDNPNSPSGEPPEIFPYPYTETSSPPPSPP